MVLGTTCSPVTGGTGVVEVIAPPTASRRRLVSAVDCICHSDYAMAEFIQDSPQLANQYDDDSVLRSYLRWRLPAQVLADIEPDLHRLGERAATDILAHGEAAE